jgi:hypothetical protein
VHIFLFDRVVWALLITSGEYSNQAIFVYVYLVGNDFDELEDVARHAEL